MITQPSIEVIAALPPDHREVKTRQQKEFLASCVTAEDNIRRASPFEGVQLEIIDMGWIEHE